MAYNLLFVSVHSGAALNVNILYEYIKHAVHIHTNKYTGTHSESKTEREGNR